MTEIGPPLNDRVALVTGVSRRNGIGFAIARRLGNMGARLFLHGWSQYDKEQPWGGQPEGVAAISQEFRQEGIDTSHIEADLLDAETPAFVVSEAVAAYGHVDMLVANHAYSTWQNLDEMRAADIDAHLLVNVRGTLLLAQAFARQHDGRPGGRVIMMTSGQHLGPMKRELAYAASKGAIHQLTQSLSSALMGNGITVNTVNPGPTDTGYANEVEKRAIIELMPLSRWGEPDDAARLIAWLCTDDAHWITGQIINSEGGIVRR